MFQHNTAGGHQFSSQRAEEEEEETNGFVEGGPSLYSSSSRRHQVQSEPSWTSAALLDDTSSTASSSPRHRHHNPFPTYGRIEERLVRTTPEVVLGSATVDVRPAKTIHVTSHCRHRDQLGVPCGATHCSLCATLESTLESTSLSPSLPLSPNHSYYSNNNTSPPALSPASGSAKFSPEPLAAYTAQVTPISPVEFGTATRFPARQPHSIDLSRLDEILEDVEVMTDGKTTTNWRSSFQSIKSKFGQIEQNQNGDVKSTIGQTRQQRDTIASNSVSSYSTLPRWKTNENASRAVLKSKSMQDVLDKFDATEVLYHQPSSSRIGDQWSTITPVEAPNTNGQGPINWRQQSSGSAISTRDSRYSTSVSYSNTNGKANLDYLDNNNTSGFSHPNINAAQPNTREYGANATLPRWRQKLAERTSQTGSKPAVSVETPSKASAEPASQKAYRARHETIPINFQELDNTMEFSGGSSRLAPGALETSSATTANRSPHLRSSNEHHVGVRPPDIQLVHSAGVLVTSRSPSPDSITSDGTGGGPAGLPQPRPKHHLREQMLSLGVEPRSPTIPRASSSPGAAGGTLWSFLVPSTGAVAAKVHEIEKRPATPPTLSPAGLTSALKGFQPTVYRTKPVIHLNVATSKHQPHVVPGTAEPLDTYQQQKGSQPSISPSKSLSLKSGAANESPEMGVLESLEKALANPSALIETPMEKLTNAYSNKLKLHEQQASTSSPVTKSENIKMPVDLNYSKKASAAPTPHSHTNSSAKRYPANQLASAKQQRRTKEHIPRFHFPEGRPSAKTDNEALLKRAAEVFNQQSSGRITAEEIEPLMNACNLPLYVKVPLMHCCTKNQQDYITFQDFSSYWKRMTETCADDAAKFVFTLSRGMKRYLQRDDFENMIQDIINTYPGLYFLRDVPDFHSRYVQTVISRIFFCVNRSWSGKITPEEFRRSNFIQTLRLLEETEDINSVTEYFSYEHFYVIYCKFWELDQDHDLFISKDDLARYAQAGISPLIIDRVFSGAVSTEKGRNSIDKMSYADFVTFIIAEEDKKHPTSVEYWFRCLDLDGDGVLSMWELEKFYAEIQAKMDASGIETMRFEDVLCQILDIVNPRETKAVRLSDLKRCGIADHFYNTFVNANKYYEQETSDGDNRAAVKSETGEEMSDWERFCAEEYELLMQEEQQAGIDDGIMEEAEINCDSDEEVPNMVTGMVSGSGVGSFPTARNQKSSLLDAL